jgi:hypothetical protein
MSNYVSDEEQQRRKELNELLANPPPPRLRSVPKEAPKPQMHAALAVAERGLRQSVEQLRAAHVEEMRAAGEAHSKACFAACYRPLTPDGREEALKRIRAIEAYWHEMQRFAKAAGSELWEVYSQVYDQVYREEKERWERTKEERAKNGWRWAKETTEDLRRGLAWEVREGKQQ